jgi:hypothetical protein
MLPDSSTSKQKHGCCWRCQSCTEYPTVLAVYVYCCLGCLIVYMLLVCSDIAYPWLLSARIYMDQVCEYPEGGRRTCRNVWYHILPSFSEQYNLLMMIRSVPGLSSSSGASAECVLPSLTCDF